MADPIKPAQRAELLELERKATPGPWEPREFGDAFDTGDSDNWYAIFPNGEDSSEGKECDAQFIATARNAIPQYEALVRQLEAERELAVSYIRASECEYLPSLGGHYPKCAKCEALRRLGEGQ